MQRFVEADLVRSLARLPIRLRVAFAAACAERLFPAYEVFSRRASRGDQAALAAVMERVWRALVGESIAADQIGADLALSMALIPGEDDEPWVAEQAYADDAASAVAYTLRAFQTGEPQEAAWAARRAYEAITHHVTNRLRMEEAQALAHPLVQAEIARQKRDLDELVATNRDPAETIADLRDRAKAEAATFFGTAP